MVSLENTYLNIKKKFENILELEPYCIIKAVDDHRTFWKPKNVRVLLLAESHVYTLIDEYNQNVKYRTFETLANCPTNYVKLVYCLGYGERYLVNLDNNSRTWQFWRIFASCISQNPITEFEKIEVGKTPDFYRRLYNKISLLEKLKERGIWLLDASIVALYLKNGKKPDKKIMSEIIKTCWEQYISQKIHEIKPEKIIVIGAGVTEILEEQLKKINIPYYTQKQPRQLSAKEWEEYAERYYRLCNS